MVISVDAWPRRLLTTLTSTPGILIAEVGVDRLDKVDVGKCIRHHVGAARRLAADDAPRLVKADGHCKNCGNILPDVHRPKGGRPALYCPGGGCAPSRRGIAGEEMRLRP